MGSSSPDEMTNNFTIMKGIMVLLMHLSAEKEDKTTSTLLRSTVFYTPYHHICMFIYETLAYIVHTKATKVIIWK